MSRRFLAFLTLATLLAGCGGQAAAPAGGGGGAGSSQGKPTAAKKVTLGLAMPAIQTAFWVSMDYGVQAEAKKKGVNVITVDAGGFDKSSTQIQQIQDLAQRHVDVLLVGATDAKAIGPVVDHVVAQGTPVIGLSSVPASKHLAGIIGADHYGMGAFDAGCLAKAIGGQGEVAVMAGPPGVNWAQQRDQGFLDTLKKDDPGVRVVASQYGPSTRNGGLNLMQDWMQRFPHLKGVFAVTDDLGVGAADALAAAGKTGQIKIATANLSQAGEAYLKAGKLSCEAAQQVVLQGRDAVKMALAIVDHKPYQKLIQTKAIGVTTAGLAKLDFSQIAAPKNYHPQ
jgi:TMAO reductase system protein TorT